MSKGCCHDIVYNTVYALEVFQPHSACIYIIIGIGA